MTNSMISLTTSKKDSTSVPIVILKRKYAVVSESTKEFNWVGIFYPILKLWQSVSSFLNNWVHNLEKTIPAEEISLTKEITIFNNETCTFEKVSEMPENISILIQENININER